MRWLGWSPLHCDQALVPVAAAIVVGETMAAWAGIVWHPQGGPGITPVFVAAMLLASLVGFRSLGCSTAQLKAWREYTVCAAVLVLAVSVAFILRVGSVAAVGSFLLVAGEEELVFRLAAPLAAGGIAAWCLGRDAGSILEWGRGPRIAALATAAATFTIGPGHLREIGNSPLRAVPFVAIGLLFGYVVLRTGNLIAGLPVHVVINLATVCYLDGAITREVWALMVIAALGCFALGAERAGRRLGVVVAI
jgi:hypothetical protein